MSAEGYFACQTSFSTCLEASFPNHIHKHRSTFKEFQAKTSHYFQQSIIADLDSLLAFLKSVKKIAPPRLYPNKVSTRILTRFSAPGLGSPSSVRSMTLSSSETVPLAAESATTTLSLPLEGHHETPLSDADLINKAQDCESGLGKNGDSSPVPSKMTVPNGRPTIQSGDLSFMSGSESDYRSLALNIDLNCVDSYGTSVKHESDPLLPTPPVCILAEKALESSSESKATHVIMMQTHRLNEFPRADSRKPLDCSPKAIPIPVPLSFANDRPSRARNVESLLEKLQHKKVKECGMSNFIPLKAKATLHAPNDNSFPLLDKVNNFLDSKKDVLLILGDAGSGKSFFCKHLVYGLWNCYIPGGIIPLHIDLPTINRPERDLIKKQLHNDDFSNVEIREMLQNRQFLLICDGYDECGVSTNLHAANNLNRIGRHNVKMIISCRTTLFGRNYQNQFHPHGLDRYHYRPSDLFEEATIVPFTEDDVKTYIQQHIRDTANQDPANNRPHWTVEQFMNTFSTIRNLSDLVKNPFMLWLALSALPSLSSDALSKAKLGATRASLYDDFLDDWIRVNMSRITRTIKQKDFDAFRDLCERERGFKGCVIDFLTNLSVAIFVHQGRSPVVDYEDDERDTWKGQFFGRKTKSKLLRDASPIKRAEAQFRFIHDTFLDYFRSRAFYNPDQGEDASSDATEDDDSDDDQSDDSDSSEGDESDGGDEGDSGDGADDGDEGGILRLSDVGLTEEDGGSLSGNYCSSGRNVGSFGGNDTPGGFRGSTNKNDGPSGGDGGWSGGSGDATNGERESSSSVSGSAGGNGGYDGNDNNSSGGKDSSREDKNNPRQGKNGSRSKKKGRSRKSRPSTSSDLLSKHNVFKDPQVLEFLVDRVHSDTRFEKRLLSNIKHAKSSVGPSIAAANSMTILYMAGERFGDVDLDGVQVPYGFMLEEGSDTFQEPAFLTGANFVEALSALGVPVPVHSLALAHFPQPAPPTLFESHRLYGTEAPTLCPPATQSPCALVKTQPHGDNRFETDSPLSTPSQRSHSMSAPHLRDLPKQATPSATSLFVPINFHRKVHCSTTSTTRLLLEGENETAQSYSSGSGHLSGLFQDCSTTSATRLLLEDENETTKRYSSDSEHLSDLFQNCSTTSATRLLLEDENETAQRCNSDSGHFSVLFQKARRLTKRKSEKRAYAVQPSSVNFVKSAIYPVATDDLGSSISPVIQTPEHHQSIIDHHGLSPGGLHPTRANDKPLPSCPIAMHLLEDIFSANVPTPTHRPTTPANHRARIESTPQLAFCVSLLRKDLLISTSESDSAENPVLNEREHAWLSAMQEDLSAQAHIRGLLSKLVAEFVNTEFMDIDIISEVAILGPVLCQEDYRNLLSCFIQRFDQTPLLNVDMLQGMVQLVQSASPGYLEDDDLVRILASLRMRLESTHAPSSAHVYQLVFAVSKVLEKMVIGEVKGLNRQRDHQSLLAVLRGLRGVKDDAFLKFQVDYAHQTLLYLPDDETSWPAFLRYAESIAVGKSAAAYVFKLDSMNALAAVEYLQQVAGNAIDVVKLNIEGALQTTTENATQAGGRVHWSNKKEAWFLTLQAAYVLVRQGRLLEFNKLVCEARCRFDINFQRGVCQLLGEIVANQFWITTSRRSAVDFLGELYKVEAGRKKGVKIQKCVVTILSRISKMSWPDVSEHARSLLVNLQEDEIKDIETEHPLHTCLSQPTSFPLLDRVLDISEVEYELDRMRFQRLQERLLPVFIPLHAKATLATSDSDFFPLMQRVQEFLESDRQVFLLLGDSGSGKSQFCRQLERALWDQYKVGRRIPLFINLPSIDQPDIDLIGKHLRDHNKIPAHRVQEIKQHRQLVLICDGYDESRLTTNLYTTNGLNQLDVKIVISCRNTFLSSRYEGRFQPQGFDKYHDVSLHLFEEATIVPFSESDIHEFVKQYVMDPAVASFLGNVPVPSQDNYLEKLRVIPNVMNLAKNPFLLTLALKALPFLSIDGLDQTQLEATKLDLYRGFTREWIQLSKRRLDRAPLRQVVQDVYDELLEADFEWCVRDYSKRLAGAIYLHQRGHPVVEYTHRKDKGSWKMEFFNSDIDSTLLREASPLTRAGIQHWFIHKSLLDYFLSLAVFDPDDSNKGDPGGGDDDDSGGRGGDSHDSRDSLFHDGVDAMVDKGGKSTRGYGGTSVEGINSSVGGESSFDGGSNQCDGNGGPFGGNHDSIGRRGDSGASNDSSNGDGDDSRSDKFHTCTSNDIISKLNLFKEPAVMQFLEERARSDVRFKKILSITIEFSKSSVGPSLAAANAITILFKSGERFHDVDLDGVQVPSDYMVDGTPDLVLLADSSLKGVDLVNALLALATPEPTQKAASTFTTITFSSKTYNSKPSSSTSLASASQQH